MKFLIFGDFSKGKDLYIKNKDAHFASEDLEEALKEYNKLVDEVKFYNIYFVADFEQSKRIFGYSTLEYDEDVLPFFLIGEWHLGKTENVIRADHTYITKKGFCHEFSNNLIAIREFIRVINEKQQADFCIMYQRTEMVRGMMVGKKFDKLIASSTDVIKSIVSNDFKPCKKLILRTPRWSFAPMIKMEFKNTCTLKESLAKEARAI